FSIICGSVGGGLVYLAIKYFGDFVIFFNGLVPNTPETVIYVCFGVPIFLLGFLLSATLYVGLVSKFTGDMDREWISRFGGWVLLTIGGWLIISLTVLMGYRLFESFAYWEKAIVSLGSVSGLISLAASFSRKSPAKPDQSQISLTDKLLILVPQIAA